MIAHLTAKEHFKRNGSLRFFVTDISTTPMATHRKQHYNNAQRSFTHHTTTSNKLGNQRHKSLFADLLSFSINIKTMGVYPFLSSVGIRELAINVLSKNYCNDYFILICICE